LLKRQSCGALKGRDKGLPAALFFPSPITCDKYH
jgi:hypothetical protein